MAKFFLTMDCDNDAFAADAGAEVARVLVRLAAGIARTSDIFNRGDSGAVDDVNGNTVGEWAYEAGAAEGSQ